MITTALLIMAGTFLKALFDIFLNSGTSGAPEEFTEAMTYVFSQARGLDFFFPVHEALTMFRWGILIFFTFFFFKVGMWIYSKIPIIGK